MVLLAGFKTLLRAAHSMLLVLQHEALLSQPQPLVIMRSLVFSFKLLQVFFALRVQQRTHPLHLFLLQLQLPQPGAQPLPLEFHCFELHLHLRA